MSTRRKKIPLDYTIVSILANLPSRIKNITTEKTKLHHAFYRLRNTFSLLSSVPFETTYFPYSENIEQAFDNIEMSGLISKTNPVLQKFYLNRTALKKFYSSEIKNNLEIAQIKEIKNIAKEFPQLLSSS